MTAFTVKIGVMTRDGKTYGSQYDAEGTDRLAIWNHAVARTSRAFGESLSLLWVTISPQDDSPAGGLGARPSRKAAPYRSSAPHTRH